MDPSAKPVLSSLPSTMKAVRLHGRGGASQLFYEDAPVPRLQAGDALVRVYATGITPAELTWDETYQNPDGSPRIPSIPGHEVAGTVESLAPGKADFHAEDAVYGLTDFPRDGAAAEFVAVRAANLAPKPNSIDFVHAAAMALSGLTAWQALFTHANLQPGQKVLIHGGAGGLGVFAVQLARWRGAHVSATARAKDAEFLRGLGADRVIDYATERFEEILSDQDLVLDLIGGETQELSWKVLRRDGLLINLSAPIPKEKPVQHRVRGMFFIVEADRKDLTQLAHLADGGALKSIVSRVLPLADARQAFELPPPDRAPGKAVIQVRAAS